MPFKKVLPWSRSRAGNKQEESSGVNPKRSDVEPQEIPEPPKSHDKPPGMSDQSSNPEILCIERQSYWGLALEDLKKTDALAYVRFSKLREGLGPGCDSYDLSQANLKGLLVQSTQKEGQKWSRAWNTYMRCIRVVLQYQGLVSGLASLDPHKIAPVVVNGVCALLQASVAEGNLNEEAVQDVEGISVKLSYRANIEAEIPLEHITNYNTEEGIQSKTSLFANFETQLVGFYKAILKWQVGSLLDVSKGNSIVKILQTGDLQHRWENSVKNIKSKDTNCETAYKTYRSQLDQNLETCRWISQYDPLERHEAIQEQTGVDSTYRDCGQWLIDSDVFQAWYNVATRGSRCLWLRGTVGTGKTTLMTRIIQYHLERSSTLGGRRLAYFYCTKGVENQLGSSSETVIKAILRQLAVDRSRSTIAPAIASLHNKFTINQRQGSPSRKRCLQLLQSLLASGTQARIFIDSLDECGDHYALLQSLRSLDSSSQGRLEILISSRAEADVKDWFQSCALIDVNEDLPPAEMERYITMEIKTPDERMRILKGEHPDLEDELVVALLKRANGMFRYTQLQISLFANGKTKWIHPANVEKVIDRLKKETVSGQDLLNKTYDEIVLRNVGDKHKMPSRHHHAVKLYSLVLSAFVPLTIDMLVEMTALIHETGEVDPAITRDYIRELTRDILVEVRGTYFQDVALDFAHISVQEYLGEREDYAPPKIHQNMIRGLQLILEDEKRIKSFIKPAKALEWCVSDLTLFYALCMWVPHWRQLLLAEEIDVHHLKVFNSDDVLGVFSKWQKGIINALCHLPASTSMIPESQLIEKDILNDLIRYVEVDSPPDEFTSISSSPLLVVGSPFRETLKDYLGAESNVGRIRSVYIRDKQLKIARLSMGMTEAGLKKIFLAGLLTLELRDTIWRSERGLSARMSRRSPKSKLPSRWFQMVDPPMRAVWGPELIMANLKKSSSPFTKSHQFVPDLLQYLELKLYDKAYEWCGTSGA